MTVAVFRRPDPVKKILGWLLGAFLAFVVGTQAKLPPSGNALTDTIPPILFAALVLGSFYRSSERTAAVLAARLALAIASFRVACGSDPFPRPVEIVGFSALLPVLLMLLELARDLIDPSPLSDSTALYHHWTGRDWLQAARGLWTRIHPLNKLETPVEQLIGIVADLHGPRKLKKLARDIERILCGGRHPSDVYIGRDLDPVLVGMLFNLNILEAYGAEGYRIYETHVHVVLDLQHQLLETEKRLRDAAEFRTRGTK